MPQTSYTLYQRLPGLVLGFHGCDAKVGEDLLAGHHTHLRESKNKYDWLGNGIYFWENDPLRALEFAQEGHNKTPNALGYIEKPFVLGAVIDLGLCLNLMDRKALSELALAYEFLRSTHQQPGSVPPYDTVRSAFPEGDELYAGAFFLAKNHIQIAVRNPECIKGYFRPIAN